MSDEIFALKLEKSEDRSEKLYALARLLGFKVFIKARKRFGYKNSGGFYWLISKLITSSVFKCV